MFDKLRRNRDRIGLLCLCWMAYTLAYVNRLNFSVALLGMQQEQGMATSALSLIGTLFYFSYAFGQLINGKIGDRVSAKTMILAGLLASSLCNLAFGCARSLPLMAALWAVNGLSLSALWGPITRRLSERFSKRHRDAVAMIMNTSMAAGYLLSWGTGGPLMELHGWRSLFIAPGVVTLLYGFVLLALFPGGRVRAEAADSTTKDGRAWRIRDLWKSAGFVSLIVACGAQGIIKDGISLFSPYIVSVQLVGTAGKASPLILLMPLFNLVGSLSAYAINRRWHARTNATLSIFFGAAFVFLLALVTLAPRMSTLASAVLIGGVSACMYSVNMLMLGSIPMRFAPYGLVSSVAGLLDFSAYMATSGASALSGRLLDIWGIPSVLVFWCAVTLPALCAVVMRHRSEFRVIGEPTQLLG